MIFGVTTSSPNPGPNVAGDSSLVQVAETSAGNQFGQASTSLIGFYGATPVARPAATVDVITQLVANGLLASGSSIQSNGAAIAAGATKTLVAADAGKRVLLDTLAGSVVTLPAATGSGRRYRFSVSVIATSNSHVIKVANATDFFVGIISTVSDDAGAALKGYMAANSGTVATNSDTITLNRSTTGSVSVGEWIEVEDIATATWQVSGVTSSTGTEATPFSAAV